MITRKTDYALRALVYLKENKDRKVPTREIAEVLGIPYKFLTQIFLDLVKSGIVTSERGSRGGMTLKVDPNKLSLLEIIEASEGPFLLHQCLSDINESCFFSVECPIKITLHELEEKTREMLSQKKLGMIDASDIIKRRKDENH